jgi:hypothetical protein
VTIGIVSLLSAGAGAAPLDVPALDWQPRSDWVNVKTAVAPAVGDGATDDTAALQAVLERSAGKTVYLPPGTYRITQTLVLHGTEVGSAIIGAGRKTRLVWDGPAGGRMFWSDGAAYSRYIGLTWDGCGKAAVGVDHAATKRFETEVSHENEAFRNFTGYGIRVGNEQKLATAEVVYHNCLFENCGAALGFLTFNDYDNTIDGCEFRNCGVGVLAHKSNFYARNCHFENSREADFRVTAEHGCSIRRCTSEGAKCFVIDDNFVAPLTLQDCQVANWTGPAAVSLGSPTLMFDCVFTGAPSGQPPVRLSSGKQKLLLSNNQPSALDRLVQGASAERIYVMPKGAREGVLASPGEHFLRATEDVSGVVFDAMREFGAKADGRSDDSAAIQSAIDAARQAGHGAVAYLPTGRYRVSQTLMVVGTNYTVSGNGIRSGLVWHGKAGEPLIVVTDVQDVTLADLAVGNSDLGAMNHGDDIRVSAPSGAPCHLTLDRIYAFGKYQNAPDKHGIHFVQLPAGSTVDARMVQGNLRMTGCGGANLLFRTSYEGTVTLEGAGREHAGCIGFLTRLTTASHPALRVFDNQSVTLSDFYVENSEQVAVLAGSPGQDPGAVTMQSPKVGLRTDNPILDLQNYAGRVYYGQSQFYCQPAETKFQSAGAQPLQLLMAGNCWHQTHAAFALARSTALTLLGNSGADDTDGKLADTAGLAAALDDLRRVGELDHTLGHTQP